jgi:hypothetical protein
VSSSSRNSTDGQLTDSRRVILYSALDFSSLKYVACLQLQCNSDICSGNCCVFFIEFVAVPIYLSTICHLSFISNCYFDCLAFSESYPQSPLIFFSTISSEHKDVHVTQLQNTLSNWTKRTHRNVTHCLLQNGNNLKTLSKTRLNLRLLQPQSRAEMKQNSSLWKQQQFNMQLISFCERRPHRKVERLLRLQLPRH